MAKKGRVFSGARPTGRQHLGNYLGAVKNYVALQDDYDCVYCIVDLHALTTVESTQDLAANTYEMALDWLAAGIDPDRATLVLQSAIPAHSQFSALLSMLADYVAISIENARPSYLEPVQDQRFHAG